MAYIINKRRSRAAPNAAFLPSALPNLAAWFRFGVGIRTSDGTNVTQWEDQSGNGRHLKQSTDTNRPAKQSDNSILFDGVDNYLKCDAFTLNQPETVYILGKQITWVANDAIWAANAAGGGALVQVGSSPAVVINAGASVASNTEWTLDTYAVVSVVINGASSRLQINNGTATTGDAGAGNMGGFTLGSNAAGSANFSNIQIKEAIVYAAAHSLRTRNTVIKYLAQLGGISL